MSVHRDETAGTVVNKRKRAILSALEPAVTFALQQSTSRPLADVVGLSVRPRVTAEAPAEIMIYGRIGGGGWFDDGISANDVAAALREAGPGPVNVRINSGGGDVFDGVAIHSLLARHNGTVTTYVDGLAASAASFIMLAGERVVASRNSMVMIHDAMTGVFGAKARLARALELLDKVSDNIADMYAEKAGEDVEFWRAKMEENGEEGVWYTGAEALDAGLVDEIAGTDDDDEDVDARLSGWVNMLPAPVAERVSNAQKAPDVDDSRASDVTQVPAPIGLDADALTQIMKEVFA